MTEWMFPVWFLKALVFSAIAASAASTFVLIRIFVREWKEGKVW